MNKIWTIARHEFITAVKRLSYIILTLSLPLLACLGMLVYYGITQWAGEKPPEEKPSIGYVDEAGISAGDTGIFEVNFILYEDADSAMSALLDETVVEYFIIPADYMESGKIDRYTTEREIEPPLSNIIAIKDFLIFSIIGDDVSGEVLSRVQKPLSVKSFRLDTSTGQIVPSDDEISIFVMPYVFALLFLMSLFFSSGYLLQSVSEEKENRLIEILLSSVSARQLLSGKVIGLGGAGLLQIAIWLLTALVFVTVASSDIAALSNISFSAGLILLAILYFILGYLLFGILMAAIGSLGSTARESSQWTTIVALPAVLPLMLIGVFVTNPDHVVFTILTFFPLTAPIAAVMKLSVGELPLWQLALSVVIMMVSIALAMWLASRMFRTFLLMYGKRPGIAEIWRYLRHG